MLIRSALTKRPVIAIEEKNKGAKGSNSNKMPYNKKEARRFPVLSRFLYGQRRPQLFWNSGTKITLFTSRKWSSSPQQEIKKIQSVVPIIGRNLTTASVLLQKDVL